MLATPAASPASPKRDPSRRRERPDRIAPRRRILLVDDDAVTREVYQECLATHDFECRTAADGREALLLAKTTHPDVVVLDVSMPGMDGYSVLRVLRASDATAHIPVVLFSAFVLDETGVGLRGADALVRKPCSIGTLLDVVRRVLLRSDRGC
jgi:CheY-like chemotaxis protein